jgi:hypothetical protein
MDDYDLYLCGDRGYFAACAKDFLGFLIPRHCVTERIVYLDDEIGIDPFSPFHEQGCSKGRCVLESFKPNEVLVVRILLDLFHKLPIRESHPLLNDERTKNHPAGFCNVSCCRCEYGGILRFPSFPWQPIRSFHPFILTVQLHPTGCIELEKAQL